MDKSIRLYGENIESRLKNMGLSVDILFPNLEIPLGKVIGNIASRGVSYAICLHPENQSHGSLTLNVLQGEQQEHRNMPVDDAMSFISKNFSNRLGELELSLPILIREASRIFNQSGSCLLLLLNLMLKFLLEKN